MPQDTELADTLEDEREPESSKLILEAIEDAERSFAGYMSYCRKVDNAYSLSASTSMSDLNDDEFALFWASMEIVKPAIYAKPPKPIAAPRFKDGGLVEKTVAELIERCLTSAFERGEIDEVMLGIRDDLALTNRGVAWVTYESDAKGGGQRVCIEHLDRIDFMHEPARKWSEVGWVARRAWMTKTQMRERFRDHSDDAYMSAQFEVRRDHSEHGQTDTSAKAGVWEVWSRADNRVYWVSESVPVILDEGEPHLNLRGFFPCPRPAYGTLQRRSLIPVPDYRHYAYHLEQINDLTRRIYVLLEHIRVKVLIPGGGEIGQAVETALKSNDDSLVIPVPQAALTSSAGNLMVMLPIQDIATTIAGLIEARTQLINDFYQLSGISDIMRGATEAQETLGAQQLKSQYGSVRVRDKIDELQRIARDVADISAEIMAVNFSQKTLLGQSRMTIPKKSEITKKLKETQDAAKAEMDALTEQIEEAGQQGDPQAIQQQFQEQQQAIVAKYQPILMQLGETVVIEDVMEMLRDTHARNLIVDIETDSTILTDEMAEKQSRSEFLSAFNTAAQSIAMLMQAGEPGAKLAGGILKFALQPYRANRELDALVDEFTDNAANMPQGDDGEGADLAAANMKLAEAEMQKAQAQIAKVQADAALKEQELQLRGAEAQSKAQENQQKFMLEVESTKGSIQETEARVQKIYAEIQAMGVKAEVEAAKAEDGARKTDITAAKTAADIEARNVDQAMSAQRDQRAAVDNERSAAMGARQQSFSEQQGDRQLTMAERQAQSEQGA